MCELIAVVKKTFRYSNGFFYKRLYRNSLFRNFIMESGIIGRVAPGEGLNGSPQIACIFTVALNVVETGINIGFHRQDVAGNQRFQKFR